MNSHNSKILHQLESNPFTLVELILVMMILATIMAATAPRLSGFAKERVLKEESQRFIALTRFAEQQAVSSGQTITLWIDIEQGEYGIESAMFSSHGQGRNYQLPDNLEFSIAEKNSDGAEIIFSPNGLVENGLTESIELVNKYDEDCWREIYFDDDKMCYLISDEESGTRCQR